MFRIESFFIQLSILMFLFNVIANANDETPIKNGRHYIRYLSTALEVPSYEIELLYKNVKFNLPKKGSSTEFYASKDSIAQIADYFCGAADVMVGDYLNLDYIYERLLQRKPTEDEKNKEIKVNGEFSFYANCFVIAMHPDVIKDN